MKAFKNGNLAKLVAFFLIAISLTAAIAVSASGWLENDNTEPDSGNIEGGNPPSNDNADENKDGPTVEDNAPVVVPTPTYTHYLTGLEISEADYLMKPFAVVADTAAPMYGISSAIMTVEIPLEDGKTRYLLITPSATSLGKLGSICPTRKYISNIASYLGGVLVSRGEDDYFDYAGVENLQGHIDFSANSGYSYSEFDKYHYTNGDLVGAYIKNHSIGVVSKGAGSAPYIPVLGAPMVTANKASKILISYDDTNTTEFSYSKDSGKYNMTKNGAAVKDLLNDKSVAYDNVFVLYADSTTHETAEATQLILDTKGGGKGTYFANGSYVDISWTFDADGNMVFLDSHGEKLTVRAGTSYISFVKASRTSDVVFE